VTPADADAADRAADLARVLRTRVLDSSDVKRQLADDLDAAVAAAGHLVDAILNGRKLLLFGNGGSAADAQHIAAELIGHYYLDRPSLPAIALTVDTSALTAIANDMSFDLVFARQLDALGQAGDVAIGLTTSGNSRNVLEGLRAAKRKGLVTVAMTGRSGGAAADVADVCVKVPSSDTPRIQESHILLGHVWAEIIEAAWVAETARK
jgi:D-sedoheptulose 7-phosphate isomerase